LVSICAKLETGNTNDLQQQQTSSVLLGLNMARGDHLYYFLAGGTYSHHGLDCGDGTVIHYDLTPWMKITGKFAAAETYTAKVARTSIEGFSRGSEVFVREYDENSNIDDVDTVMYRAENRIGEKCYSVFDNNCEHFVVWCKTGEAGSSQVEAHLKATQTVLKGAPIGALLFRAARRVPGRYRGIATIGSIAAAGAVYLGTYLHNRVRQMGAGIS